jgi:apolipoprotein N-acyltransferase
MLRIEKSAWVLAVISGVLQVVIFPLENLYMLSWVAVAPLLVAILRARRPGALPLEGSIKRLPALPMQGFLLGYLCGIVWYAGNCYWVYATMKQYGGIGSIGAAGLLLLFCLYLGLYHGAFGLVIAWIGRRSLRTALVAAPFVWVALEFARTRISGFPWDLLGIAQTDNIPLARIARVTGIYGISLEIMIVNTAFAAAFLLRHQRRISLLFASFAAAFVLQIARWMPVPAFSVDRSAVLVQENVPVLDNSDWTRQYFEDTLRQLRVLSHGPEVGSAQNPAPGLIVWPESPAPFYGGDPEFRRGLSQLAIESQAWVVAGNVGTREAESPTQNPSTIFNSASLISPSGEWLGRYDKVHLVPFGEYVPFRQFLGFAGGLTKEVGDFTSGATRVPLQAGDEKLGIFICYESIFPDEVRT